MGRVYKCVGCGARVNGFIQDRDAKLLDLPPCSMCEGTAYVPILEQLPPEEPPIPEGSKGDS